MKHSKPQIASTWDKIASKYGAYRRKSWSDVSKFLAKSKTPILDIGCGNAAYATDTKQKIIGVDLSFEMCKLASKQITAIQADASQLPIKSKSFYRALSIATLHNIPTKKDRLNFLKEIKRILRPNGKALVTIWYRWQKKHLPKALVTKNIYLKWGDTRRFYHLFSMRELARLAGKFFDNFRIKLEQGTKYKNLYLYIQK